MAETKISDEVRSDLLEWFTKIGKEAEDVVKALFHTRAKAYPKETRAFQQWWDTTKESDVIFPRSASDKKPGNMPRIHDTTAADYLDYLAESEMPKDEFISQMCTFWSIKVFFYRKELEKQTTFEGIIELFKKVVEDYGPLLFDIGRESMYMDDRIKKVVKGGRTKSDTKAKRVEWVRSQAEKFWSETEAGFEIATKRWEHIIEKVLDREDIGVSAKTLGNYRRDVEELLKKEGSKTQKIILKRKSVR